MYYSTFLLDYSTFRREARPLILAAEAGDYTVVVSHAKSLFETQDTRRWILEGHGASLSELYRLEPGPVLTGLSFLVVLGEYLRPVPFDSEPLELDIISQLVLKTGWDEDAAKLMQLGMALTVLIAPEKVIDPLERPPASDSRWHSPTYY
jgi:hypothetical protein